MLSLVSRACFVGACVVGSWSWTPGFFYASAFGLHVFCECFVIASASASAIAIAIAIANVPIESSSFLNSDRCILIARTQ